MAEVRPVKALLDVNVALDVLLQRDPFFADARAVWDACDAGRFLGTIGSTTLTNIYYIARKIKGRDAARQALANCFESFEICPTTRAILVAAFDMNGRDFEDDVQIQSAVASSANYIVTRNPTDFAASPIPVLTPAAFLGKLARPGP